MPYKSKAEQESENWMTLPQVATHVRSVDGSDEHKARRDVLKALKDSAFYSRRRSLIRWKDIVRISGEPPNEIGPHDVPPQGRDWAGAKIRWTSGTVLDPYGAAENGKWRSAWRIVWLARSKVTELWPPSLPPNAPAISSGKTANVVPFTQRRTGPKTGKLDSIVKAMREEIRAKGLTIDELRAMPDKMLLSKYGKQFEAQRTICRDARTRAVAELDGNSNSVK